jgi:hypothetical protein
MEGALIEPLAVGFHAANLGDAHIGQTAVVFGAGCIGLVSMMALKAKGVSRVYVVDIMAKRLEKALELLNVMAANKQIIYFICHPIRAVETGENSASREEFLKLAEATRQTISEQQAGASTRKKIERKSPKEMYKVVASSAGVPFRPAKPNYTITNSIFSMNFVLNDNASIKNNSYELFFIDAKGHVLNERQLLEINNGKLSTDRIRFSLNTRDDSGDSFELMVRESGQSDDYEVAARFPFKAKMAFTGTFSFDF